MEGIKKEEGRELVIGIHHHHRRPSEGWKLAAKLITSARWLTHGQLMNNRSLLILRESPSGITGRSFSSSATSTSSTLIFNLLRPHLHTRHIDSIQRCENTSLPASPGDLCDSVWRLELCFDQSFPKTRRPVGNLGFSAAALSQSSASHSAKQCRATLSLSPWLTSSGSKRFNGTLGSINGGLTSDRLFPQVSPKV